ncbi:MAG: hypothetical protein MHMPM18_001403 [Marteilia pararefringens]
MASKMLRSERRFKSLKLGGLLLIMIYLEAHCSEEFSQPVFSSFPYIETAFIAGFWINITSIILSLCSKYFQARLTFMISSFTLFIQLFCTIWPLSAAFSIENPERFTELLKYFELMCGYSALFAFMTIFDPSIYYSYQSKDESTLPDNDEVDDDYGTETTLSAPVSGTNETVSIPIPSKSSKNSLTGEELMAIFDKEIHKNLKMYQQIKSEVENRVRVGGEGSEF